MLNGLSTRRSFLSSRAGLASTGKRISASYITSMDPRRHYRGRIIHGRSGPGFSLILRFCWRDLNEPTGQTYRISATEDGNDHPFLFFWASVVSAVSMILPASVSRGIRSVLSRGSVSSISAPIRSKFCTWKVIVGPFNLSLMARV
jgi:hypothetical protein